MSVPNLYTLSWLQGTEQVNRDASTTFWGLDTLNIQQELDQIAPWWRTLQSTQQTGILELVAIFGVSKLMGIDGFAKAMQAGQWQVAVNALEVTSWYAYVQSAQVTPPGGPYKEPYIMITINPNAAAILTLLFPVSQQGSLLLADGTHFKLGLGGNLALA